MSPSEGAARSRREASARILAATLTLISREQRTLPPPYSLWTPRLDAVDVREVSMLVADGKAQVVWADESHPARGLLLYRARELETELLGHGSAMLQGPFLVEPDPDGRQERTGLMAARALEIARGRGDRFLSVKTYHDPAVLRGYSDAGFRVAEVATRLAGPLPLLAGEGAAPRPAGVVVRPLGRPAGEAPGSAAAPMGGAPAGVVGGGRAGGAETGDPDEVRAVLDGLGDLFYDGHHLHGPFLPDGFSGRLWRLVAERDLSSGRFSALVASDTRRGEPVGLATGSLKGERASLAIIHVAQRRRGQGLGRLLLSALSSDLYERGGRTIEAETASWNLPALTLYLDAGMRPTAPLMALHYSL
ncbi:MAG: GNAT family N-acetyltransferase [Deltaproteobacteria bacterium]|nr:GNAT family N-acetyltransferase [Deltaproteobacteria bacterium]